QAYTESVQYIPADIRRQSHDIGAPRSAEVHQHQCLIPVNPNPLATAPLPPRLLYQPACCQLYRAIDLGIMGHAWILVEQHPRLGLAHQRVLEEASGIAQFGRIRQFAAANVTYQATDNPAVRPGDSGRLPGGGQGGVIQPRDGPGGQAQPDPQNDIAAGLLFEQTVTVGKPALLPIQPADLAGAPVQCIQALEKVAQLDSVGTDVLHRCRAKGTGNQRQVFQPMKAQVQAPAHQLMPVLPGLPFDQHTVGRALQYPATAAAHNQGKARNRPAQYQIAAATDQIDLPAMPGRQLQSTAQAGLIMNETQPLGTLVDAKGVHCRQCDILLQFGMHSAASQKLPYPLQILGGVDARRGYLTGIGNMDTATEP